MPTKTYVTKSGKHGTLYLYRLTYRDSLDPGCPTFSAQLWAYSAEHAVEGFQDADDPSWEIVDGPSRVKAANAP
jgi:hypothetical protein